MSLTRVHNPLSLALIRKLGDAGGPRGDQVDEELDAIVGFLNSRSSRVVFSGLFGLNPTSGTVTSNITTIAGDTLNTAGDYLEIVVFGRFTSSGNNKEIRLVANQGGAQILCTTGTFTTGSPGLWEARAAIRRDSVSNLDSRAWGLKANAAYGQTEFFTNTWNWANSFTVDIVTVLAAAAEVFIDRALILKHAAP